jgi:hypothetical protein
LAAVIGRRVIVHLTCHILCCRGGTKDLLGFHSGQGNFLSCPNGDENDLLKFCSEPYWRDIDATGAVWNSITGNIDLGKLWCMAAMDLGYATD